MRIAFISDIHGNLTALEAVLQDLEQISPDLTFHVGDLVASGARPAEVLDRVEQLGWRGVYGNTDEMLWEPTVLDTIFGADPARLGLRRVLVEEVAPFAIKQLGPARLEKLRRLPLTLRYDEFFVCHAGPQSCWASPRQTSSDEEFAAAFSATGAANVVFGHIHFPLVRRVGAQTIVNTGSVSLPYDGDPRASYVVFENGVAAHRRVAYDVERETRELHARRVPRAAWLAKILSTGSYCDPF